MITTTEEFSFEYFPGNYSISLHKEIVILDGTKVLGRNKIDTMAFLPGTLEKLISYIGDEDNPIIAFCNTTWTPEIIAAQEAINAQNNLDLMGE